MEFVEGGALCGDKGGFALLAPSLQVKEGAAAFPSPPFSAPLSHLFPLPRGRVNKAKCLCFAPSFLLLQPSIP